MNFLKKLPAPLINYWGNRIEKKYFHQPPLVIGGCGRSGTTLLLSILSAHPHIFGITRELGMFNLWDKNTKSLSPSYLPHRMDRFYRYMISHKIDQKATRWCEKTPFNVLSFEKILDYYENRIKLIHIIRDGRDVLTSRHPKEPFVYWVDIERWVADVNAGLKLKDHPQVHTLRYEELVRNFDTTMQKLCEFLEEEFVPELRNWYEHTKVRNNKAWYNRVEKLHPKSIGKWQKEKYRDRVNEIMHHPQAVDLLKQLDYLN